MDSLSKRNHHNIPAHTNMLMDDDNTGGDDYLFRCAKCGTGEGDANNLTSQASLQTNATVGCGHQLYVVCFSWLVS